MEWNVWQRSLTCNCFFLMLWCSDNIHGYGGDYAGYFLFRLEELW
jgi:hypothetical protein